MTSARILNRELRAIAALNNLKRRAEKVGFTNLKVVFADGAGFVRGTAPFKNHLQRVQWQDVALLESEAVDE